MLTEDYNAETLGGKEKNADGIKADLAFQNKDIDLEILSLQII